MGRPVKKGLDYFPLDVDFLADIKVRRIIKSCGKESVHILIALLGNIYRDEGYYILWNDDLAFLVADEVGTKEGSVDELVKKAVQVDFFNKNLFEKYKVLTSKGIQNRYILATKERKIVELESSYLLTNEVNRSNISINQQNNSVNQGNNQQSKVKKTKVKEKEDTRKYSDEHLRLALKLQTNLSESFPNESEKVNINEWANTIRLMEERDKATIEQIEYVLDWLPTNDFWYKNVRSAEKLRKQFERLKKEIKDEKKSKNNSYNKNVRREKLPDWANESANKEPEPENPELMNELDRRFQEYQKGVNANG